MNEEKLDGGRPLTLCEQKNWHYFPMGDMNTWKLHEPLRMGMTRQEYADWKMTTYLREKPWNGFNCPIALREHSEDEYYWAKQNVEMGLDYYVFVKPEGWDKNLNDHLHYVVIVSSNQCYGGPEEGGWYYHHEELVKWTSCRTREEADALILEYNTLKKQNRALHQMDLSALGGDDTVSSTYPEGYIPRGFSFNKSTHAHHQWLPFIPQQETPHYE